MYTKNEKGPTGVILMTYGSATIARHVNEYLSRIYQGKASNTLIKDFENRYKLVGSSPLVEISEQQALCLQRELGDEYVVRSGMRYSLPFIEDAVLQCRHASAKKIIGVILSPQFASFIVEGYHKALSEAGEKYGFSDKSILMAEAWPTEKNFIKLLSNRVKQSLKKLRNIYGIDIPIVFTTHSLPARVVEKDLSYLAQLKSTTAAILKELEEPSIEFYSAYQSAGHTPEKWLKPDLVDILRVLSKKGAPAVLIVPIQFLADHLEVLYDLDIAAKDQCDKHSLKYYRIQLPNTNSLFVKTLYSIVKKTENSITLA